LDESESFGNIMLQKKGRYISCSMIADKMPNDLCHLSRLLTRYELHKHLLSALQLN